MKKNIFKQLSLNGDMYDYSKALDELKGVAEITKALNKFYKDNAGINPRQLHYFIETESCELHLMELMEMRNILEKE